MNKKGPQNEIFFSSSRVVGILHCCKNPKEVTMPIRHPPVDLRYNDSLFLRHPAHGPDPSYSSLIRPNTPLIINNHSEPGLIMADSCLIVRKHAQVWRRKSKIMQAPFEIMLKVCYSIAMFEMTILVVAAFFGVSNTLNLAKSVFLSDRGRETIASNPSF
jgi:hypothetical protein